MGRFGPIIARFYAPSDLSAPLDIGGTDHQAVTGWYGPDESSLTFVNTTALNTLAAMGNICWAVKTDALRTDLPGNEVTFSEPFIVRSRATIPGSDMIEVRGPALLAELSRWMIARPLGHETTISTKLAAAAAGPVTGRSMDVGSPAGNDTFKVTSPSNADNGKELRVKMDDDTWFVSEVTEIREFEGDKYLITRDRNPVDAGAGKPVELRTLQVKLDSMSGVAAGQEITITMDSGSHTTLIDRIVPGEDGGMVVLRDGMTGSAAVNKTVTIKDYSLPSTSDVTKIMAFATGWTTEFETGTGTAAGTRYPGGMETVYDILRSVSEETGEWYRLKSAEASPAGPKRKLVWRRTADTAGVSGTLRLVMPSQANMATDTANINRAILIERPSHAGNHDPTTQIFPTAGDARVTLFSCSSGALSAAAAAGFNVVTTGLGLYAPPYVVNTALNTSIGVWQRRVTFSEVTVEADSIGSIQSAADRLLALSINYLREHTDTAREITARCVSPVGIREGQKLELYFESPTGEYTIDYIAPNYLYVQSVRRESAASGDWAGVPITSLTLTPSRTPVPKAGEAVGKRLAAVDRAITRISAPSQIRLSIPGGSGNTPPVAPPVTPPGGGGSDHDPVTAADTSITVTGQAIKVNPATNGGLEVSSGLKVKPDAGKAIELGASGVGVTLATNPGLEFNSGLKVKPDTSKAIEIGASGVGVTLATNGGLKMDSGISLKFPANAGIKLDGTGAYLDPDTLTYATTNTVTGSKHTHAITAIDSSVGGETGLLKTTDGKLAVKYLGAGVAADTSTAIYGVASATGHTTLWLKQIAGQTGDIWRVENSSGTPYVRITGPGHMESGNPGFVSGQTGWRIWNTGNAEFNDLRVRGELHASVFVADEMHAVGGTLLVKTASRVGAPVNNGDNKLGAIDATFKLRAELSWDAGLNYFPKDTVLRIKPMGEIPAGGSLDLYDIYAQVTAVGSTNGRDLSKGNPGTVELTCKRRYGGATNFVIPTGSAVVKWTEIES